MAHIKDLLSTPALVVDLDRLERNIADMAAFAKEAGLKLRPHAKAHKTPQIARRQIEAGARGITVAKLGEAEVMLGDGIQDIMVAYQIVGGDKISRLMRLAGEGKFRIAEFGWRQGRENMWVADLGKVNSSPSCPSAPCPSLSASWSRPRCRSWRGQASIVHIP